MDERDISTDPGSIRPMRICPRATDKGAFADFLLIEGSPVDNLDILGGQGTHESNYESWKSTKIQGKFTKNGICPQVSKGQEASSTLSGKRKLGGWGTKIPDYIMEELQGQKELAVTVPGM